MAYLSTSDPVFLADLEQFLKKYGLWQEPEFVNGKIQPTVFTLPDENEVDPHDMPLYNFMKDEGAKVQKDVRFHYRQMNTDFTRN